MTKTASERFEKQNFAPGAVTLEKNAHTFRRGLKMQSGASLQNVYDCTSKAQQHQRKTQKKKCKKHYTGITTSFYTTYSVVPQLLSQLDTSCSSQNTCNQHSETDLAFTKLNSRGIYERPLKEKKKPFTKILKIKTKSVKKSTSRHSGRTTTNIEVFIHL